ncbi:hypothetical protein CCHR01_14056 [Colletotrichum chrysophilum]|uniref:Uncharacterized protein n=1 Tax=Colletotrichum chrysophilum TaxID=1836956 RepID=A0AAD9A888_9PEZI|nr:hypothetical protein CCHR01_14056 [Colletotrichum chrysophilum]
MRDIDKQRSAKSKKGQASSGAARRKQSLPAALSAPTDRPSRIRSSVASPCSASEATTGNFGYLKSASQGLPLPRTRLIARCRGYIAQAIVRFEKRCRGVFLEIVCFAYGHVVPIQIRDFDSTIATTLSCQRKTTKTRGFLSAGAASENLFASANPGAGVSFSGEEALHKHGGDRTAAAPVAFYYYPVRITMGRSSISDPDVASAMRFSHARPSSRGRSGQNCFRIRQLLYASHLHKTNLTQPAPSPPPVDERAHVS